MRFLAIITVKNEAAFLLEWLAHHRAVGFTDFLVFSNDCNDGTDTMLDQLQSLGLLTHVRNDGPYTKGVQWHALKTADDHPLVQQADWIMTLDIDEFVNIHTGDHTLNALLTALPVATAIPLTWRLFGNNGIHKYADQPITEQFTRAAPAILHWPWRAAMFKTLFRNDGAYKKLGVHRPRSPVDGKVEQARWFDGTGRELPEQYKRQKLFSPFARDNYQLAQLNHYALGAMESYVIKQDRGRSNVEGTALGLSYWVERNWNTDEDISIAALKDARDTQLQSLKSDPTLSTLHANAVKWRQNRFDQLMDSEPNRSLYGRLMVTPPSTPPTRENAEFLYRYAQKSQSTGD